jgi:hypothetical protein
MTPGTPARSTPNCLKRAAWVGVCAVLVVGCKSSGGKNEAGLARGGDPLLGNRIPPQNLPVNGRDAVGSVETRDPLLGLPAKEKGGERAGKTGDNGSAALPFRPGRGTTNAALANPLKTDDTELSIGDRRTPGATTGRGPVPFRDDKAGGLSFAEAAGELRRLGAKVGEPEREGGGYVVRAEVPLDPDNPARLRWYEEAGPTPAAAAKRLLEQVKSDRK